MAGDVKTQQFLNDKVKPAVHKTIPEMLRRIEELEQRVGTLMDNMLVASDGGQGLPSIKINYLVF